jgi:hypothetical protein
VPAEYEAERADCADCGATLVEGPSYYAAPGAEEAAAPALPADLKRRIAVTAVGAVLLGSPLLGLLQIPGLDLDALSAEVSPWNLDTSVFALGILPWMSAAVIVELAALIFPSFRDLRHGGPEGRRRLGRAQVAVGVGLTLFQGYGIARMVESMMHSPGVGFRLMVMLSLAAGSGLLLLVANALSRWGLVNGLLLFVAAACVKDVVPIVEALKDPRRDAPTPLALLLLVATPAVAALLSWWTLRWKPAGKDAGAPPSLRPPLGGLPAALMVASLPFFLLRLEDLRVPGMADLSGALFESVPAAVAVLGTLTLAGAYVLSRLQHRPAAMEVLWSRASGQIPSARPFAREAFPAALREAFFVGAPLVLSVVLLGRLQIELSGRAELTLSIGSVVVVTAIGMDLVAELRARQREATLVPVWPEHRPFAANVAAQALEAAGIPVHLRGAHVRPLYHFFAPYAPIEVMVPEARAEEATRILRQVLLGESEETSEEPRKKRRKKKRAAPEEGEAAA